MAAIILNILIVCTFAKIAKHNKHLTDAKPKIEYQIRNINKGN